MAISKANRLGKVLVLGVGADSKNSPDGGVDDGLEAQFRWSMEEGCEVARVKVDGSGCSPSVSVEEEVVV
jgi:hypothetical protein